ncbi:MAG TPA: DUF1508 domain-containing protein [Pyrinomonadaceae bacterium]
MVFEIYKDVSDKWRWRLKARNGEIVGDSSESYHNRSDLFRTLSLITETIKSNDYTIVEK